MDDIYEQFSWPKINFLAPHFSVRPTSVLRLDIGWILLARLQHERFQKEEPMIGVNFRYLLHKRLERFYKDFFVHDRFPWGAEAVDDRLIGLERRGKLFQSVQFLLFRLNSGPPVLRRPPVPHLRDEQPCTEGTENGHRPKYG